MAKEIAARLRALAARLPDRLEIAADLLALAGEIDAAHRGAAQASVRARAASQERTRREALAHARAYRRSVPDSPQADVAAVLIDFLGSRLPGHNAVARWVRGWELDGHLPPKKCKSLAQGVTGETSLNKVAQ